MPIPRTPIELPKCEGWANSFTLVLLAGCHHYPEAIYIADKEDLSGCETRRRAAVRRRMAWRRAWIMDAHTARQGRLISSVPDTCPGTEQDGDFGTTVFDVRPARFGGDHRCTGGRLHWSVASVGWPRPGRDPCPIAECRRRDAAGCPCGCGTARSVPQGDARRFALRVRERNQARLAASGGRPGSGRRCCRGDREAR